MPKTVYYQKEIGKFMGYSEPMASLVLRGLAPIPWKRAKKISKKIGVPPSILMDATPAQLKALVQKRLEEIDEKKQA